MVYNSNTLFDFSLSSGELICYLFKNVWCQLRTDGYKNPINGLLDEVLCLQKYD